MMYTLKNLYLPKVLTLLAIVSFLGFTACSDDDDDNPQPSGGSGNISFDAPSSLEVEPDDTTTISLSNLNIPNGYKSVDFTIGSGNGSVTVDNQPSQGDTSGTVTATLTAGSQDETTTVTVTINDNDGNSNQETIDMTVSVKTFTSVMDFLNKNPEYSDLKMLAEKSDHTETLQKGDTAMTFFAVPNGSFSFLLKSPNFNSLSDVTPDAANSIVSSLILSEKAGADYDSSKNFGETLMKNELDAISAHNTEDPISSSGDNGLMPMMAFNTGADKMGIVQGSGASDKTMKATVNFVDYDNTAGVAVVHEVDGLYWNDDVWDGSKAAFPGGQKAYRSDMIISLFGWSGLYKNGLNPTNGREDWSGSGAIKATTFLPPDQPVIDFYRNVEQTHPVEDWTWGNRNDIDQEVIDTLNTYWDQHWLSNFAASSDLSDGDSFQTPEGQTINVSISGGDVTLSTGSGTSSTVNAPDVVTFVNPTTEKKTVIHGIDQPLIR